MPKTAVLVVLDSLRYDIFREFLSEYPNSFLSDISEDSMDFNSATAPAPWSLPSHGSIFTGSFPQEHGALSAEDKLPEKLPTIVDDLQNVQTGCFSANPFINPEYGFGNWDCHRDYPPNYYFSGGEVPSIEDDQYRYYSALRQIFSSNNVKKSFINSVFAKIQQTRAGKLFDNSGSKLTTDAIDWIESLDDEPAFIFLNYMETHDPHKFLSSVRARLKNIAHYTTQTEINNKIGPRYYIDDHNIEQSEAQYAKQMMKDELKYVDMQLQRLWQSIDMTGRTDDCLFIVCSDHGDGLGEYGKAYHMVGLTEPIIRTPLLVRHPTEGSTTVSDRVSLEWIYGTLREYYGMDFDISLLNSDSYPQFVGSMNTDRIFDLVEKSDIAEEYLKRRLVVYESDSPNIKYRSIGSEYSILSAETNGVKEWFESNGGKEIIAEFKNELNNSVEPDPESKISVRTRQSLEDLGYL